jgi:hypothetical protein
MTLPSERAAVYFMALLGLIALAGIIAGVVLATSGYSSAAPFSVASACVGVLGTLVATGRHHE